MNYPDRDRQLARKLAEKQEITVSKLVALARYNLPKFELYGGEIDEEHLWFNSQGSFNGVLDASVFIDHSLTKPERYLSKVGVRSGTRINLGLHTDNETLEEVKKYYKYNWEEQWGISLPQINEDLVGYPSSDDDGLDHSSSMHGEAVGTYYFLDRSGNSAKVISLPKEIAGDRTDLMMEDHPVPGIATVLVPIQSRDFVLIGKILETINANAGTQ